MGGHFAVTNRRTWMHPATARGERRYSFSLAPFLTFSVSSKEPQKGRSLIHSQFATHECDIVSRFVLTNKSGKFYEPDIVLTLRWHHCATYTCNFPVPVRSGSCRDLCSSPFEGMDVMAEGNETSSLLLLLVCYLHCVAYLWVVRLLSLL